MIDFGFDLAGRREPLLTRGAVFSAFASIAEVVPLTVAFFVLDAVFRETLRLDALPWVVAALLSSVALTWWLKTRGGYDNFAATYSLVCDTRLNLADHLRRLPMGFWSKQRTGTVSSVLTHEFGLYTEIVTHVWSLVVAHLAKPVAIAAVLLLMDWRLALLALLPVPLAVLSIPWSYRLLNRASDRLADVRGRADARLVEYVQGIKTLREYGQTGPFFTRLEEDLRRLEREMMRTELAPAPALFSYKLLVWLGFSLMVAGGVWAVSQELLSGSRFLLFALLSLPLYDSISELSSHLAAGRFASRTLERIRALFAEVPQTSVGTGRRLSSYDIEIDDVSFSYEERPAVQHINARIAAGEVTALVGPSGSGKSTLAHLITRLWDVDSGSIRIGGIDLREMPLSELRSQIATVFQDVALFHETVAWNIQLGKPDASREEVVEVAKAARAHDFIEALPDGYETVLGEGGADLSGGQRQRLSIARALLLDAPVLVLDEATSSVDPDTESQVQDALNTLMRDRTVIVIAHRLWTIRGADRILVLDRGRVVESGRHEELVEHGGVYRRMWDLQQDAVGWRLR
ncbi:MAG: ABC transporter ATP-binding protein [Myxococcota bacterium]